MSVTRLRLARRYVTVVEVDPFPATAAGVGLTEDEREAITTYVANSPEVGEVVPGTGGLRKLRWPGKGGGKRGGYRVVYYFFNESNPVYLLAIYKKSQQIDLTAEGKKRLIKLAGILKASARARGSRRVVR